MEIIATIHLFSHGESKVAKNYQIAINRIDALYPDTVNIPTILKLYLARKGIIADPMSYIALKRDKERMMSPPESSIAKLGQKVAL